MITFLCLFLASWSPLQQERKVVSAGDLFKTASPSVVLIATYGEDGKAAASGTGFIVAADGVILTNYHVVAHTKRATVRLANGDAYDDVSVLDLDKRKDIALIKIKAIDLAPLKLGRSDSVQVGDKLYAVGNPLGVFQNTLSEGILSGIRQGNGYRLFQLSTPVSEGSSGSPVFDGRGDVVGIVKATVEEGQNISLAIPIDYAAGLLGSRSPRSLESIYEPLPPGSESSGGDNPSDGAAAKIPDALKNDAWAYLTMKITLWTQQDAEKALGKPSTRRDVVLDSEVVGDVCQYQSPDSRFSKIELNFERPNGKLFLIYFYPQKVISWQDMKAGLAGIHVTREKKENGSIFYNYKSQGRMISVWVDSQGNVVNVALY